MENFNHKNGVSRRSIIGFAGSALALGLASAAASPARAVEPARQELAPPKSVPLSRNGWPIEADVDAGGSVWNRTVGGTALIFAVRIGAVERIFTHLIQRYHYEIDSLREGDIVGFKPGSSPSDDNNHRSGTAIDIRPSWYPAGISGGYSSLHVKTLTAILADFEGIVAWGGSSDQVDESHFELVVGPDDERLERIARRLEEADNLLGSGFRAGT